MIIRMKPVSLADLIAPIQTGTLLAIPPDYLPGVSIAATRASRGTGGRLRLVAVPTSSLQADLLIGASLIEAGGGSRAARRAGPGAAFRPRRLPPASCG